MESEFGQIWIKMEVVKPYMFLDLHMLKQIVLYSPKMENVFYPDGQMDVLDVTLHKLEN